MDQNVERRIRDRAYSIWVDEGRPSDRDVDHWLRAAQEIAAEEHRSQDDKKAQAEHSGSAETAGSAEKPKKARAPRSTKSAAGKGAEGKAAEEKTAEAVSKPRRASKSKPG